jgi:hypothetical protein
MILMALKQTFRKQVNDKSDDIKFEAYVSTLLIRKMQESHFGLSSLGTDALCVYIFLQAKINVNLNLSHCMP